jgi:single-strand DNA-binding protein
MNKVILVGNLVNEPEMSYTPGGVAVTKFRMATNDGKDREGNSRSQFHNIVIWGKGKDEDGAAAVAANFLKSGHKVGIVGKITENTWEHEGKKHYRTEIVCDPFGLELLTTKAEAERMESQQVAPF